MPPELAPYGQEIELTFNAPFEVANPYVEVEAWAEFRHSSGKTLRRPAFWDGGETWRVRFVSLESEGEWTWTVHGLLTQATGSLRCEPSASRGTLRMSPGGRNAVWDDGSGFFIVSDTAWALPFRATQQQTELYARDRRQKGFNATLLMTVQPDTRAEGPDDRTQPAGFGRGFRDLPSDTLRDLDPAYFQHLDGLIDTLLGHEIVPIHAPLFYGFGWKGKRVIGPVVDPVDARRFVRYLVARYGARPALWLVGADGTGLEPAVAAMGEEVEAWDAYGQPTGIHYNPWQATDAHWNEPWCDFHLCQTGHDGEHWPERVAIMQVRSPARGVANGEPTYEGMGNGRHGLGGWQGEEAWRNVTAGGTFGVWYGAASLWQWKHDGEDGWDNWCAAPWGWEQALAQEGSRYPGLVGRALTGMDFVDMVPRIDLALGKRCVAAEGRSALVYLPNGGSFNFVPWSEALPYRALDARTGETIVAGRMGPGNGVPFRDTRVELPSDRPIAVAIGAPVGLEGA